VLNPDGISLLCSLLTDDGGLCGDEMLSWMDEGINRIESVKNLSKVTANWGREAWGVELYKEYAKIYFLFEEDYFEIVPLASFETAILNWKKFIQLEPSDSTVLEIEI
jgi:hypothetical protein